MGILMRASASRRARRSESLKSLRERGESDGWVWRWKHLSTPASEELDQTEPSLARSILLVPLPFPFGPTLRARLTCRRPWPTRTQHLHCWRLRQGSIPVVVILIALVSTSRSPSAAAAVGSVRMRRLLLTGEPATLPCLLLQRDALDCHRRRVDPISRGPVPSCLRARCGEQCGWWLSGRGARLASGELGLLESGGGASGVSFSTLALTVSGLPRTTWPGFVTTRCLSEEVGGEL